MVSMWWTRLMRLWMMPWILPSGCAVVRTWGTVVSAYVTSSTSASVAQTWVQKWWPRLYRPMPAAKCKCGLYPMWMVRTCHRHYWVCGLKPPCLLWQANRLPHQKPCSMPKRPRLGCWHKRVGVRLPLPAIFRRCPQIYRPLPNLA